MVESDVNHPDLLGLCPSSEREIRRRLAVWAGTGGNDRIDTEHPDSAG